MSVTQSKANAPEGVTFASLAPARHRTRRTVLNAALPYLAIAPAFLTFVLLLGIPVVVLFWTSVQRYGLTEFINHTSGPFVGLQNYIDVIFNAPQGLPDFGTVLERSDDDVLQRRLGGERFRRCRRHDVRHPNRIGWVAEDERLQLVLQARNGLERREDVVLIDVHLRVGFDDLDRSRSALAHETRVALLLRLCLA